MRCGDEIAPKRFSYIEAKNAKELISSRWNMGYLSLWPALGIFMSSIGVLDQPGYWPAGYVSVFNVFLVLLTAFLGFRALFWPFRSIRR